MHEISLLRVAQALPTASKTVWAYLTDWKSSAVGILVVVAVDISPARLSVSSSAEPARKP